MKKSKNVIYLAALIIICIPLVLEQLGNPMTLLVQTITLLIGLAILFFGKMQAVSRKRRAGIRPATHDTLTLAVILFMAGYILYNYFV